MRELRKRKVRFPLVINNNKIRRLDDLRNNPDTKAIISYYANGKLDTWLRDRYYDDEADCIEELDSGAVDFIPSLLSCLGIEADAQNIELSEIKMNNKKLDRVKRITDDKELIKEYHNFAFDDYELSLLLKNKDVSKIYLYGERFSISEPLRSVVIEGIDNPVIDLMDYSFNDLKKAGCTYSSCLITSKKLEQVKSITNDEGIISNFENVVFDDDMFNRLLNDTNVTRIWAYGDRFTLKNINGKKDIVGLNTPIIDLCDYTLNQLKNKGISIINAAKTSQTMEKIKEITNDSEIIDNFENVAFDDDKFELLLNDSDVTKIWIYGERFTLKNISDRKVIIGINNPTIDLCDYNFNQLEAKKISINNVNKTSFVLEKVKGITKNKDIISNFEKVAFDNNQFHKLLNSNNDKIYLYGEKFSLRMPKHPVEIIGVNKNNYPVMDIGEYSYNDLKTNNINYTYINITSERLERVRKITDSEEILNNFDKVAFDDDQLNIMLKNEKVSKIYLYGNSFKIPFISRSSESNKTVNKSIFIEGINKPSIELEKGKSYNNYTRNQIYLLNVTFKDSASALQLQISELREHDIIQFGTYNKVPIEWVIAEKKQDYLIAIALNLDIRKRLNEANAIYSWSDCSLRKWLNTEYYENSFNYLEKAQIQEANLTSHSQYKGSSNTCDNVYILSLEEYTNLYPQIKKKLYGTWLRSSTYSYRSADVVDYSGIINTYDTLRSYRVAPVINLRIK